VSSAPPRPPPHAPDRVQRVAEPRLRLKAPAATTRVDGNVVVAGENAQPNGAGAFAASGATWIFGIGAAGAPATPRLLPATLATPRARHTMTRLGDDVGAAVLIAGGPDAPGPPV